MLTLPTSACATGVLDLLGFKASMYYGPQVSGTLINIYPDNSATVNWPCAGIHSLFLFTLIMILLLRKTDLTLFRKTVYFIFGLAVTYLVNVLRIVVYFLILLSNGKEAAAIYHRDYGELLFIAWIGLYILLIVCIEKFRLIEKIKHMAQTIRSGKNLPSVC
jgi:exosortase/archaeosortase family protein